MGARRVEIERGRYPSRFNLGPLATWLLVGGAAVGVPALANALVRRRAAPPRNASWGRSHHFEWDLGEVAFKETGSGPPVLLLHSLGPGHDGSEWRRASEALAADHRVYVPDLLGWGRSEKPLIDYRPEVYLALLRDVLSEIVREPALVVAAGLTAAYAVHLAAEHPELFSGLVLVAPAGLGHQGDGTREALLGRLLEVPVFGTSALNLATSRAALERHLRTLYAAPERVDAALIDHHYRASHLPDARPALSAYLAGRLWHDATTALPHLRVPVALLWGRQAVEPPVEAADLWLRRLPGAQLEVLEGCGSLPHAEAPARFASALRQLERGLTRT